MIRAEGRAIHHGDRSSSPTVAHDCDALDRSEIASRSFVWAHQERSPGRDPSRRTRFASIVACTQPWCFAGLQHRSQPRGLANPGICLKYWRPDSGAPGARGMWRDLVSAIGASIDATRAGRRPAALSLGLFATLLLTSP